MTKLSRAFLYHQAFRFLSLDISQRHYHELGVPVLRGHDLQFSILGLIEQWDESTGSPNHVIAEFDRLVGEHYEALDAALGRQQSEALQYWVLDVYDNGGNAWFALEATFLDAASAYRRTGGDVLGIPAPRDSYQQLMNYTAGEERELIRSEYAEFELQMNRPGAAGSTPRGWQGSADQAALCFSMNRFQLYWEELVPLLNVECIARISTLAQSQTGFEWPDGMLASTLRRRIPSWP